MVDQSEILPTPRSGVSVPHADVNRLRRQAIRGGTLFLASRLTVQAFQWLATILVARLLAPVDYGLMATALLFVGLADLLAEAGLGRALMQKPTLTPSDQAQAFTLSAILALLLYGLLWLLAGSIAAHFAAPQIAVLLRVTALVVLLVPLQAIASAILERDLRYGRQSAVQLAMAAVQSVTVLALALAGYGVWALAFGAIVARLVQTALVLYFSRWRPALALPSAETWRLLRFGLTISATSLVWFAYSSADMAIVSALLGPVLLGYYSMAYQLIMIPIDKISAIVNQVSFATYCKLQSDRPRLRDWFSRLMVLRCAITFPAIAGIALVANDAVPLLLGEKWRPACLLIALLAPVAASIVVSTSFAPLFNAISRPEIGLYWTAANVAVFPVAFWIGCRTAGLTGICVAWLICQPTSAFILIQQTSHLTSMTVQAIARKLAPVLMATLAMICVVFIVQYTLAGGSTALRLCVSIVLGAAAYVACIWNLAANTVVADVKILTGELSKA